MTSLLIVQMLNGLQLGVLLFLIAAGLTLVFGIMNFINLAHGSVYMLGAYISATLFNYSGSFLLAITLTIMICILIGVILEVVAISRLYQRNHLDQVLATFGLILFFNEVVQMIWGPQPYYTAVPEVLNGTIELFDFSYPAYRFAIIATGLLVAAGCYLLMHKTRLGMLIRAGADNAPIVNALGVNISRLNAVLFGLGAGLAALAGIMVGPILSVQSGMGEPMLITTLVVIVIGGIGSIRGAFFAALIVGVVDTFGRAYLPNLLRQIASSEIADAAGPAIASMLIYMLMAAVLVWRPNGLFPVHRS
jgi:branched-chain amino acid transport system permease protein